MFDEIHSGKVSAQVIRNPGVLGGQWVTAAVRKGESVATSQHDSDVVPMSRGTPPSAEADD
jgi:hypothetical protein